MGRSRMRNRKAEYLDDDNEPTLAEYGAALYNRLKPVVSAKLKKKTVADKAAEELAKATEENAALKAKLQAKQLEDENKKMREQLGEGEESDDF